eukprot:3284659-Alexandrium_andersonii.AAC.1
MGLIGARMPLPKGRADCGSGDCGTELAISWFHDCGFPRSSPSSADSGSVRRTAQGRLQPSGALRTNADAV